MNEPIIEFKKATFFSTSTPKALKTTVKIGRLKRKSESISLNPSLKDCLGVIDKVTGEAIWL